MDVSHSSLSKRFEAFVPTLAGYESIDSLLQGNDPPSKKRADYLFQNREFIVEQKTFTSNPVERPQKFVDSLAQERKLVIYGSVLSEDVFAQQPDAQDLQRRLLLDMARIVDDVVARADKQTADTREIFKIPSAAGILIILNESAGVLRHDVVYYALMNTLKKKRENGARRYRANNAVILISEATTMSTSVPGEKSAFPIMFVPTPEKKHEAAVSAFSDTLAQRWAEFNNSSICTMAVDINLGFK